MDKDKSAERATMVKICEEAIRLKKTHIEDTVDSGLWAEMTSKDLDWCKFMFTTICENAVTSWLERPKEHYVQIIDALKKCDGAETVSEIDVIAHDLYAQGVICGEDCLIDDDRQAPVTYKWDKHTIKFLDFNGDFMEDLLGHLAVHGVEFDQIGVDLDILPNFILASTHPTNLNKMDDSDFEPCRTEADEIYKIMYLYAEHVRIWYEDLNPDGTIKKRDFFEPVRVWLEEHATY